MKKIVMCLTIIMAIGLVAGGCSREKKEEVKPAGMVEKGLNKVTVATPAPQPAAVPAVVPAPPAPPAVEGAKEQVGGAVTDMGQMKQDGAQPTAPQVAEPVTGAAGQAVDTGKGVVQEGVGVVQGGAGALKQETDQAVEALPQGAGGVVDEEARKAGVHVK